MGTVGWDLFQPLDPQPVCDDERAGLGDALSLGRSVECEPLDWLTGYICDELEIFVVVQDSELGQLGGGGD